MPADATSVDATEQPSRQRGAAGARAFQPGLASLLVLKRKTGDPCSRRRR